VAIGDLRTQRIVIETARHRIAGDVTLPSEGHNSRLSDLLNREGLRFVAVVNAEISNLDGEGKRMLPFVAVARDHVQLAYEDRPEG
jgi:hypothetical protein